MGVIASSLIRSNRSLKNSRRTDERCGNTVARQSSFERSVESWKIVGASSPGSSVASSARAAVAWVVIVSARFALTPSQGASESVYHGLYALLAPLGREAVDREEIPARLPLMRARAGQVKLKDTLCQLVLCQAALDARDGVLVRIDEHAALPPRTKCRNCTIASSVLPYLDLPAT
jgi:hypothetical protein